MSTPETKSSTFIDVPAPLFKYRGDKVIHDDNLAILSNEEGAKLLVKGKVKQLKEELKEITQHLLEHNVEDLLIQYDALTQEHGSLKLLHQSIIEYVNYLPHIQEQCNYPIILIGIVVVYFQRKIRAVKHRNSIIKAELTELQKQLSIFRPQIIREKRIQQRLKSHYAAVEDEKKTKLLQEGMSQEAQIIAQQMQQTLARLGHMFRYSVGKRTKTDLVQFDHVVATPDQLQFKVKASRRGLFGGTIDLLPQGVYVTDLLKDRELNELSIALEREVWSPHTSDDNIPLVNGAWIIVERLGLVEGIPRDVTYAQLMARYETADHDKIPIPAGLKRGRRVNWIHLDSPQGIHIMFTGISGSGKSNAMRAMISAVIEKQSPIKTNFVFIDLKKQGDFREFEAVPHCIRHEGRGVLTEIEDVVEVLKRVRQEMHMRQTKISFIANNLEDYNKRVQPANRMPKIVIVFDEYANTRRDRFDEEAKIIDDIMIEIGQVGRASGISMWIGIQQPRSSNMPAALRDNITTQFVGHQANVGAAQSATGNRQSLKLEDIPGRMMANIGWKADKVQMPYIPEEDVKLAVQIARDKYGEQNPYALPDDSSAASGLNISVLSDEELVLKTAFEHCEGMLKKYPIYEVLRGQVSRERIGQIIKELAEERYIEHGEEIYRIDKQSGNFYALIPLDEVEPDNQDNGDNHYLEGA